MRHFLDNFYLHGGPNQSCTADHTDKQENDGENQYLLVSTILQKGYVNQGCIVYCSAVISIVIDLVNGPNEAEEIGHKVEESNGFDACNSVGPAAKKLVQIKVTNAHF